MRARRAIGTLAVAILAAGLVGCSSFPPMDVACVPRLVVSPAVAHPGETVTVATGHACDIQPPSPGWTIRLQPDHATDPHVDAHVMPGEDGSFVLDMTVPENMPSGRATAWITDYWDVAACPDSGSCAAAEGHFEVAAR